MTDVKYPELTPGQQRRALKKWKRENVPSYLGASTRAKKKARRSYRKHAEDCLRAGLPERAAIWKRRARNG